MKIIHCADLHLDSKLTANLPAEKAKERRNELLVNFSLLVDYAYDNGATAVLISGDLFDKTSISRTARNVVYEEIKKSPEISFFYLRGNHDSDGFIDSVTDIPDNLYMFGEQFKSYVLRNGGRNVVITGAELTKNNSRSVYNSLFLDEENINIVMLHGQKSDYKSADNAEIISISALKNKNIDYLALGHIHEFKNGRIDGRGMWCYPGCLEGRGFDECGDKGFVLLDITSSSVEASFIPFAKRRLFEVSADMTGVYSSAEGSSVVRSCLRKCGATYKDLVKVTLTGDTDLDSEIDTGYLQAVFSEDYYYIKIIQEMGTAIDYGSFMHDAGIKGEFVRIVNSDNTLTEEEKAEIIRYGIMALNGEAIL